MIGYADISSTFNKWVTDNSMRSEMVHNVSEIADLENQLAKVKKIAKRYLKSF